MHQASPASGGRRKAALFPFPPTIIGLTILTIVMMLGAAVAWNFVGRGGAARAAVTQANLRVIRQATDAYALSTGGYPTTLTQLVPAYLPSIRADAWGRPLIYAPTPGAPQPFDLRSAGPDAVAGNADDIQ